MKSWLYSIIAVLSLMAIWIDRSLQCGINNESLIAQGKLMLSLNENNSNLVIIDDASINKFDNSDIRNETQSILYNFDWLYFGFDEYKINDQLLSWDELYKLWKEENLCNIWKSEFRYIEYNNDNWEELKINIL